MYCMALSLRKNKHQAESLLKLKTPLNVSNRKEEVKRAEENQMFRDTRKTQNIDFGRIDNSLRTIEGIGTVKRKYLEYLL